ncbi:MAG: DinB family protein [Gemmatimonadaceae bacterium]|nr:DinB family protein [Gemmatimonadaceae bacterium]
MTTAQKLLAELDQEMGPTRRLLERVPSEHATWKPHPKSFPLGHLAQLVARMPGWLPAMLTAPQIDLAAMPPYSFAPTPELLAELDAGVAAARAALASVSEEAFDEPWSLKRGDMVLFTAPRGVVVRQHMSHMAHHRGQLTVYLRLKDVPIPSIYGPTADERMFQPVA